MWHTGSGYEIDFEDVLKEVHQHSRKNGNIFVGCDSQIIKSRCVFSTIICLHGADDQSGGKYFFNREKISKKHFPTLVTRLTKEVEKSIEIASMITDINPNIEVEIHIDANAKHNEATSKFSDMLIGYARGAGFSCKIKPDAWASSSIADKHSKRIK
jgi:predicted RNase H-related nuclease YkuK (DUF458 family)